MAETPAKGSLTPKDLITVDQVKKVLLEDKGGEALLSSWKIVDFNKPGENFSRFVTSILVNYSLNNQELEVSYIAKVNPCKPFGDMESHFQRTMKKEATFLMELIPQMNSALEASGKKPLQFPKCYHGDMEAGKEQLYFEDLRANGFTMADKKKGLSMEHATLVLKELARFHATWRLLQAKCSQENLEQKYDLILQNHSSADENAKKSTISVMEGNFTFTMKVLKNHGVNERAITWIESLKPQIDDIITNGIRSDKFETICHGDCWNNNILFRYDNDGKPVEAVLLDLEVCRKASIALDLNYFLYTSVAGDVRRAHLDKFLHGYYSSYSQVIEAGGLTMHFTEEELQKEFREKNVVGAAFGMLVLPSIFADAVHMPDMSEFEGDFEMYCNEFRDRLAKSMNNNPLTEPRLLAMFDEFMESGLIP